jgi:hypothetical protein
MRRHFDSRVTRLAALRRKIISRNPRGFDSAADLQGAASCCSSVISQIMFQMGPPFHKK